MLPLLIMLSLHAPAAADIDVLTAKAKEAQKRGNEHYKAGNDAGVTNTKKLPVPGPRKPS